MEKKTGKKKKDTHKLNPSTSASSTHLSNLSVYVLSTRSLSCRFLFCSAQDGRNESNIPRVSTKRFGELTNFGHGFGDDLRRVRGDKNGCGVLRDELLAGFGGGGLEEEVRMLRGGLGYRWARDVKERPTWLIWRTRVGSV